MEIIKSKKNSKIKYYKSLLNKKNRYKYNEYLIEGYHLCTMAKEAGVLNEIIITPDTSFDHNKKILVTKEIIDFISDAKTPQPIVGVVKIIKEPEFDFKTNFIILDNLQDPGNLGSILRSALAFDFKNIVLSKHSIDLFNPKVLRSAQGAHFKLNIMKKELLAFIPTLKHQIITTDLSKKTSNLSKLNLQFPLALIVGNEGQGIRSTISALATYNYVIKINDIDSLNVAVASSIIMEKLRQLLYFDL